MRYNEGAMKNTTRKSLIAAIAVYGLAVLTTPITAQMRQMTPSSVNEEWNLANKMADYAKRKADLAEAAKKTATAHPSPEAEAAKVRAVEDAALAKAAYEQQFAKAKAWQEQLKAAAKAKAEAAKKKSGK